MPRKTTPEIKPDDVKKARRALIARKSKEKDRLKVNVDDDPSIDDDYRDASLEVDG